MKKKKKMKMRKEMRKRKEVRKRKKRKNKSMFFIIIQIISIIENINELIEHFKYIYEFIITFF